MIASERRADQGWVWVDGAVAELSEVGTVPIGASLCVSMDPRIGSAVVGGAQAVVVSPPVSTVPRVVASLGRHAPARSSSAKIHSAREPRRFDACFIEAGANRAGFGRGDFYAEPAPEVKFYRAAWWWHTGTVLVERRSLAWL